MAFEALKARIDTFKRNRNPVGYAIMDAQKAAATAMVDKATELTPPVDGGPPRGANAYTGQAKAGWWKDSIVEPNKKDLTYTVQLINNTEYIDFINDGFRMDRHYVPGLVINEATGLLDKLDPSAGGIVVGTRTSYVEGLYMREQARDAYDEVLKEELTSRLEELTNG